ncbi:hypothetical protein [Candidatus Nitrosocosmicus sp. T]
MNGLPYPELLNKYDNTGMLYNTTSCQIEFDVSKASHGMYCEEVSNIDGFIALREDRLGGCDQVIKTDYSNYEQYGYTRFGDSTSIYLRPK